MLKLTNTNGNVELKRGMMKGDDGGYYIPSVDENGELTWTPSEEGMTAVDEKINIVGPRENQESRVSMLGQKSQQVRNLYGLILMVIV